MKRWMIVLISGLFFTANLYANSAPVISSVAASQRNDDSKLVDITYNLADADGDNCTVWIAVSNNGGTSFKIPARSFTGDIGNNIPPGSNKHVAWDAGGDMAGMVGNFKVRVYADDGNAPESMVLVAEGWFPYQNTSNPTSWVYVDSFMIGKYEVTNAQYVQYLNNRQPDSDTHWNNNMKIDRYGQAGGYTYAVHSGKENYPIQYINFYGSQALIVRG